MAEGMSKILSSRVGERLRTRVVVGILALIAACAASGWSYYRVMSIANDVSELQEPMALGAEAESVKESEQLDAISAEFVKMNSLSASSMQTALLAEISSRHPVALAASLFRGDGASGLYGSDVASQTTPQDLELDPPQVSVVAIMISGKDKIAMINVLGEDTGLVVKQGSPFSAGTARITKIDEQGVSFRWMDKTFTVVM